MSSSPGTVQNELDEILAEKRVLESELEVAAASKPIEEVAKEIIKHIEKEEEGFVVGGYSTEFATTVTDWSKNPSSGGGCIIL